MISELAFTRRDRPATTTKHGGREKKKEMKEQRKPNKNIECLYLVKNHLKPLDRRTANKPEYRVLQQSNR